MQRLVSTPRPDWQRRVESQGMFYHTPDGQPYWDESACYLFTTAEIEQVEQATYPLNAMCLQAVEHVITNRLFAPFDIPVPFHSYVLQSWEAEGPYGNEPCVYQELASLPVFDDNLPVVGSWMVNGYACGLGIREDRGPITHNTSRFVPHFFGP
jgi:glutathionylspermidine synthase